MPHKKNKRQKVLKSLLLDCFGYYRYKECIILAKKALYQPYYAENWESVKQLIQERKMATGVPLSLIHNDANLPLEENSDEEAYVWFDLLIQNLETEDDNMVIYPAKKDS